MSTQTTDREWTQTEPLPEAMVTLHDALDAGTAKRFVVGTDKSIKEEQARINLEDELADIQTRMTTLEARADQSIVAIPTQAEVIQYGSTCNPATAAVE